MVDKKSCSLDKTPIFGTKTLLKGSGLWLNALGILDSDWNIVSSNPVVSRVVSLLGT